MSKWNVYYAYQGELYCAGQYDNRREADKRANALRADKWNGVYVRKIS